MKAIFVSLIIVLLIFGFSIKLFSDETGEYQLLDVINKARADKGLVPLIDSTPLSYIAQEYATEMGTQHKFNHFLWSIDEFHAKINLYVPKDSPLRTKVRMFYQYIAQVPYNDKFKPQQILDLFSESDLHRVGLLSDYGRYIGIGYCISNEPDDSELLWVCVYTGDVYK